MKFALKTLSVFALLMVATSYQPTQSASCCDDPTATCSPTGTCNACKNCKYCKHCSKNGGSCSVCRKKQTEVAEQISCLQLVYAIP